jgi:parallel beta-helix repeat protein
MKTRQMLYRACLIAIAFLTPAIFHGRAAPTVSFTVNIWQDSHDSNTADGVCNNGFGGCSLRAAVEQANVSSSYSNPITILFDDTAWDGIPVTLNIGTIPITAPYITIDGETRDIKVSGLVNGVNQDIFEISSGFITIRNLTIQDAPRYGIYILAYATAGVGHDVLVEDVKLVGNRDSAILIQSEIHIPVFTITIRNSLIGASSASSTVCVTPPVPYERNRNGIVVVDHVEDVTIDNVNVVCSTETGIYLMGIYEVPENTIIRNSRIGTNGSSAMGNGLEGIAVFNTMGTQIRNNVISGNGEDGVWINLNDGATLTGNKIGLNADGTAALPNAHEGVSLRNGSANNKIGGFSLADRNWISGNGYSGVYITDSGTHSNLVAANYLGLGTDGSAIPNGNAGVAVMGGYLNLIGVASTSVLQVISSNNREGVYIQDAMGTFVLDSNVIGTTEDQKFPRGNGREGIKIVDSTISSITPQEVSFNGAIDDKFGAGIAVTGASAWSNGIRPKLIHYNSRLAIDLGNDGPTDNGSHSDTNGPNQWIGYPLLTGRSGQTITGRACANCRVDIYSVYGDPRAAGGGGAWVDYVNANGQGIFQTTLPVGVGLVTLTATDSNSNTSEMSPHLWASYLPLVRK